MKIGIDGSRAFLNNRTGIEEYSYQTIKHLRDKFQHHQVILYIRKNQEVDFELPENWRIKKIKMPRFWTQIGLSFEMLIKRPDVLLIPAHTVPPIHPKRSIVVVHGLEYEFCPNAYSAWAKFYMRTIIKNSCKWSSKIISVSQNTKKDLMHLYGVPEEKISVIYEGYDCDQQSLTNSKSLVNIELADAGFLLFIGRIEDRKNIINVIKAFELLREKKDISQKLILAGKPGYGYDEIKKQIDKSKYEREIIETGFISDHEKWQLLKKADVFVFPTKYEGFGIPVLEAQSVGCPVVASNNSSIPEICSNSSLLVNSEDPSEIAESVYRLLSDESLKNDIIQRGLENVKKFNWEKCSQEIAELIKN